MTRCGISWLRRYLSLFISHTTVEPVEFIYCLMFTLSNVVRDNLFIEKVCKLDFKCSDEICFNMTHGLSVIKEDKDKVQKVVAELEAYDGILVTLPSVLFCLFVGSWSDKHGRKVLLILPFLGNVASYLAYMINYAFFDLLSSWHLLWGSSVGLFGGYVVLNIGLYGYISDVTQPETRTMRMSILNGVFSAGYIVGASLGGLLYDRYDNYYLNFGASCALAAIGVAYTVFFIKESVQVEGDSDSGQNFFDVRNITDSVKVAFKPRPGSGRIRVILLVINFAIFMFPLNTTRYDYLLVMNRYNWEIVNFSWYLSVQRICRFIGLFLVLPFLSRVMKMKDALIATLGTFLTIFAYCIITFGQEDWTGPSGSWDAGWIMYLSAVFQLNSIITVTIRSQCTKEVYKEEVGRIFSVVAMGQALVPLAANPLFGFIYKNTLNTFDGAYLLVVDVLLVFVLASSVYLFCDSKSAVNVESVDILNPDISESNNMNSNSQIERC